MFADFTCPGLELPTTRKSFQRWSKRYTAASTFQFVFLCWGFGRRGYMTGEMWKNILPSALLSGQCLAPSSHGHGRSHQAPYERAARMTPDNTCSILVFARNSTLHMSKVCLACSIVASHSSSSSSGPGTTPSTGVNSDAVTPNEQQGPHVSNM